MSYAALGQLPPSRPPDFLLQRADLQRLVDFQVTRNAPALIEALQSPEPAVRARAAFALASVQDSTARPALLALLRDPDPAVRADAAFALGQTPGRLPALPLLETLRTDPDLAVQALLLEALGKKGDQEALQAVATMVLPPALAADQALAVGRFALRGIHTEAGVALLLERLGHTEPRVRRMAAYYFGRSRDTEPWRTQAEPIRARLDALAHDDPAAQHLVLALSRLGDAADRPRLLAWAQNGQDWRTRVNAVLALRPWSTHSDVRVPLFSLLDDPSPHVAATAADLLAASDSISEVESARVLAWLDQHPDDWQVGTRLLPMLAARGERERVFSYGFANENAVARARALAALARLAHPEALQRLLEAAGAKDPRVAYAALEALKARWPKDRTNPALIPQYYTAFIGALHRRDLATTYAAAPALSDTLFRSLGAVAALMEVYEQLRTPAEIESMTAILDALGQAADPVAEPLLRRAVEHPHPVVRRHAATALEAVTGTPTDLPNRVEPPEQTVDWSYLQPFGPRPQLVFETEKGTIALQLEAEQAPLTTQTLLRLARSGTYDGVPFHRVVSNFVIQGGDFERGDGFGGPGFSIRSEFTRLPYSRGTAGMASAGKDTEGSQYFITHSMQPHLDGRYTAFGFVVSGQDVVDRILEDDRVLRVSVLPTP